MGWLARGAVGEHIGNVLLRSSALEHDASLIMSSLNLSGLIKQGDVSLDEDYVAVVTDQNNRGHARAIPTTIAVATSSWRSVWVGANDDRLNTSCSEQILGRCDRRRWSVR